MELVEGDDLSVVMERGPMPVSEALVVARQLVDALEAAHESGIIHRDLKPANIKVRPDGTIKVLDFGLAKAMDPAIASSPDAMLSPTLTARATQMGVIIGTAAYMAPEQAKGRAADKRADIWAFGVVLYEMLSGRRAFDGDDISTTMAAVLMREPDMRALPATVPTAVRTLIARCLAKDPKQRLRDIGDARLLLDEKLETAAPSLAAEVARHPFPARWLLPTAIVLFALAGVALAVAYVAKTQAATPSAHLSIVLPPGEQVTTVPAISPDGKTIAYAAGRTRETSRLYLRAIDSFTSRAVDSSEAAQMPFFSPDGRSVAFFAGAKLWRAAVSGGAPIAIAPATRPWGGTWCTDGTIVFVPTLNKGLWRVSENGGATVQLTKPDGAGAGYAHTFPMRLPGTDDLLFSFWGQSFYTAVFSPKTGTWRAATQGKSIGGATAIGVYADNGYLLLGDGAGGLTATRWDPIGEDAAESRQRRRRAGPLDHRQRAHVVQPVGQRHGRLCAGESAQAPPGVGRPQWHRHRARRGR